VCLGLFLLLLQQIATLSLGTTANETLMKDRQCMYNIRLSQVRATIVALEKQ